MRNPVYIRVYLYSVGGSIVHRYSCILESEKGKRSLTLLLVNDSTVRLIVNEELIPLYILTIRRSRFALEFASNNLIEEFSHLKPQINNSKSTYNFCSQRSDGLGKNNFPLRKPGRTHARG